MNELAPIILFVYNRPEHTARTLAALSKNILADQSKLYIFCDGPKDNATEEDLGAISETRRIAKSKLWCGQVEVIERKKNMGLADSVISGVTQIISKYGKVIVLEDDIVTEKFFLAYMNEGLYKYRQYKNIYGISGYRYPSRKAVKESVYVLPIGSSWGYGTWVDRWDTISFDVEYLLEKINTLGLKTKMNFGDYPYYEMLINQVNLKIDSWAIKFYASMVIYNGLFIYPNKSLVFNSGFDNSGVHCGPQDKHLNSKPFKQKINLPDIPPKIDKQIEEAFSSDFQRRVVKKKTLTKKTNLNRMFKRFFRA